MIGFSLQIHSLPELTVQGQIFFPVPWEFDVSKVMEIMPFLPVLVWGKI